MVVAVVVVANLPPIDVNLDLTRSLPFSLHLLADGPYDTVTFDCHLFPLFAPHLTSQFSGSTVAVMLM